MWRSPATLGSFPVPHTTSEQPLRAIRRIAESGPGAAVDAIRRAGHQFRADVGAHARSYAVMKPTCGGAVRRVDSNRLPSLSSCSLPAVRSAPSLQSLIRPSELECVCLVVHRPTSFRLKRVLDCRLLALLRIPSVAVCKVPSAQRRIYTKGTT
jgi:hypothetical protein